MGKLLLQGSTILRKIFENLNDEQAETGFFIINPLTMMGNPKEELSGNDGIKRRVRHEIKKDFFSYIHENDFDYFALDLFSAALLDSYKYDNNYYSASYAFVESDFFLIHKKEMTRTSELKKEENWKPLLKEFAEKLLNEFDKEKIILYRIQIHERGLKNKILCLGNEKSDLNTRLKAMEDYFIELVDPCIIDICNDYFLDLQKDLTMFEPLFYADCFDAYRRIIKGEIRQVSEGNSYYAAKRIVRYYDSIIETGNYDWIVRNNSAVKELIQHTSKLFVAEHQDSIASLIQLRCNTLDAVLMNYEKSEAMSDFCDGVRQVIDNLSVGKKSSAVEKNVKKRFKPVYANNEVINVVKSVSPSEVEKYIDIVFEKKRSKLKVPGFRAGNVEKNVALNYYGKGYFFEEASKLYIKENETKTIAISGELVISKPYSTLLDVQGDKGFKYQTTAGMHQGFHNLKNNTIQYLKDRINPIYSLAENVNYIVFFSISDMNERASVFSAVGSSPEEAVSLAALKLTQNYHSVITKETVIKADMVSSVTEMRYADFSQFMRRATFEKFFRYGISFDSSFNDCLLEEEMNAYQIFDYKNWDISLERVKKYRNLLKQNTIDEIPERIYLFQVQSLFVGNDGVIESLYGGAGYNKGRREVKTVNKAMCKSLVSTATEYLMNQINEDGSFIYGYYPSFDRELKSYNILRHLGTAWSMMCADDILKNKSIRGSVEKVLTHAIDNYMEEKDEDTAYIVERKASEIKLGGNGIAIITMAKFMENYGGKIYLDYIRRLANGMVEMQDPETGRYNHVLNFPEYTIKEAMRTVYYDGESTYALVLAYEHTGDKQYLECAKKALDYQIANNYIKYRDHWLAYAFNAYVRHDLSEKYVDFALRNAKDNLISIRNQGTSYHTYQELLTMTLDTYLYAKEQGYSSEYFEKYNLDELKEVIRHRAWHMLDGYWYPEFAMYMGCPKRILGSFFVRHDGFRTRIDDDQHFMDGYVKYAKLYADIK